MKSDILNQLLPWRTPKIPYPGALSPRGVKWGNKL